LSASIHSIVGLNHALSTPAAAHASVFTTTTVNVTLPAQANEHAEAAILIHFGSSTTPPADSGGSSSGGSGNNAGGSTGSGTASPGTDSGSTTASPSAAAPGASNPGAFAVFSTGTTTTVFSAAFAREVASLFSSVSAAQQAITTTSSAASFAAASLGILLPPGQSTNATTVLPSTTNGALPPNTAAGQALASAGNRQFPGAESIPYLGQEGSDSVALFGPADAPLAAQAITVGQARTAATPVKASLRLDRTINEVPAALFVPPALLQAPVEEAAAASEELAPMATPVAAEETSPWVWASVLGAAAVGTAWVVWEYWLKPAQLVNPEKRAWQNSLLGLDLDRP